MSLSVDTYPPLDVAAFDTTAAAPVAAPGGAGTLLGALRARRDAAREKAFLDLRVPGYTDPLTFVRFRPFTPEEMTRITDRLADYKGGDRNVRVGASLIATCCVGIFNVDEAGAPVGAPASWATFDAALADALGVDLDGESSKAVATVRAFYVTETDIIAVANRLTAWAMREDEDLARSTPEG